MTKVYTTINEFKKSLYKNKLNETQPISEINEGLIDWNKIEEYWDKLTTKDKKRILSLDYYADPEIYKDYDFNSLPSDLQNNLLKFLPKFEK